MPAIAGLARVVSDYTLSEYVTGLWAKDLLRSLAWGSYTSSGRTNHHARHAKYVAPSWSWASLSGPVSYSRVQANFEDITLDKTGKHRKWETGMAVILEYHIELAGADPFNRVKSGYLRLAAPILKSVLGYDGASNEFGRTISMNDFTGTRFTGKMHFDVTSERGLRKVVHCIYLFPQNDCSGHVDEGIKVRGLGLVLAPVEGIDNTYTRIGFAEDLRLEYFKGLNIETFIII